MRFCQDIASEDAPYIGGNIKLSSAELASSRAQPVCATPYTVQPGDGWIRIAIRCGVTYQALRDANSDLWQQRGERLEIGDQLSLPATSALSPMPTAIAPSLPTAGATVTPIMVPPVTTVSPSQTALESVRLFWLAVITGIRTGDFRTAYAYLTPQQQSSLPYAAFQAEFAALHEVTITSIAVVQSSSTQATVDAVIVAASESGAGWQYQYFRYRYTLVLVNGLWQIESMLKLNVKPTPSPTGCSGAHPTRLQRGMRAYVLPQPPLPNRVFREPNRQSLLVGRIPPSEAMTILDGPQCAQYSVWWYVQADNGVIGWTAEGQPGEYWLAPVGSTPPPTGNPVVGPITFCTAVDHANRCLAPTTQFPIGLKRIEVNWIFQNLPVNTPITHIWYHNGKPFFTRSPVLWDANRSSSTGLGYTFYAPLGGLPTGTWWLEFRRQRDNQLLQRASFYIGPSH